MENTNQIPIDAELHERICRVEGKVISLEDSMVQIKDSVKEIKQGQKENESSINNLSLLLTESNVQREQANNYLQKIIEQNAQFIDKLDEKIELYKEKMDDRYLELLKADNSQELNLSNEKFKLSNKALASIIGVVFFVCTLIGNYLIKHFG